MEAESRKWVLRCGCGRSIALWDAGGIRWKSAGRPVMKTRIRCPQCGVSGHTLEKLSDPPGP
jgi:hypothetical protein